MSFSKWCGDYPGFAQLAIEASHPGAMALFAAGCGADQNPLPRRQLHLCERYGRMLAAAVEEVLLQPLTPVPARLDCAAREVALDFAEVVGEKTWREAAESSNAVRARWAQRWLSQLRQNPDLQLPASYPYPVQVWLLGGAPLISLGGEAVVDYAIRCRELFGDTTWVLGYAHVLVAYIPSRRVWLEGGYEGGPYLSEYGHAAERWADGVEARILDTVTELLGNLRNAARG